MQAENKGLASALINNVLQKQLHIAPQMSKDYVLLVFDLILSESGQGEPAGMWTCRSLDITGTSNYMNGRISCSVVNPAGSVEREHGRRAATGRSSSRVQTPSFSFSFSGWTEHKTSTRSLLFSSERMVMPLESFSKSRRLRFRGLPRRRTPVQTKILSIVIKAELWIFEHISTKIRNLLRVRRASWGVGNGYELL